MTDLQITTPPDWMREVEEAVLNPKGFKFSTDHPRGYLPTAFEKKNFAIVNAQLIEKFHIFHSRAVMHSNTKGEHEAAALLNFYVIWKYKLWKAEAEIYKTWESYVQDVTSEPWSISASTLEHRVLEIDKYLERGMTIRNVIGVLGKAPMAGKAMLEAPQEALPGGDINRAAEIIQSLGPDEAGRAVNDWQGRASFTPLSAVHDEETQTLHLEVRRTEADGRDQRYDFDIPQVDREMAEHFFMARLKVRTHHRAFR